MFIFHIYNSFETEGHWDQGFFYLLKTITSLNSGKINMKYITTDFPSALRLIVKCEVSAKHIGVMIDIF